MELVNVSKRLDLALEEAAGLRHQLDVCLVVQGGHLILDDEGNHEVRAVGEELVKVNRIDLVQTQFLDYAALLGWVVGGEPDLPLFNQVVILSANICRNNLLQRQVTVRLR